MKSNKPMSPGRVMILLTVLVSLFHGHECLAQAAGGSSQLSQLSQPSQLSQLSQLGTGEHQGPAGGHAKVALSTPEEVAHTQPPRVVRTFATLPKAPRRPRYVAVDGHDTGSNEEETSPAPSEPSPEDEELNEEYQERRTIGPPLAVIGGGLVLLGLSVTSLVWGASEPPATACSDVVNSSEYGPSFALPCVRLTGLQRLIGYTGAAVLGAQAAGALGFGIGWLYRRTTAPSGATVPGTLPASPAKGEVPLIQATMRF